MSWFVPLISTSVGGVLAIAGGFLANYSQARNERKNVAGALAGEISALLEIIRKRQYLEAIDKYINAMETDQRARNFRLAARHSYFTVFEANADKLGVLPNCCASEVAKFYVIVKSLMEDATNPNMTADASIALKMLKQDRQLLVELIELGDRTVKELTKL